MNSWEVYQLVLVQEDILDKKCFTPTTSYNVLGMRRSSPPCKANRRFAVGWNVGERKPHKT